VETRLDADTQVLCQCFVEPLGVFLIVQSFQDMDHVASSTTTQSSGCIYSTPTNV